jgi:hypothetical protein
MTARFATVKKRDVYLQSDLCCRGQPFVTVLHGRECAQLLALQAAIEGIECLCNYHTVPNLHVLPPIPDNLDSPLLYNLPAAMSVYVLLFVWLGTKSRIGLLEAFTIQDRV